MFVRITHNQGNTRESRDFLRSPLRVTSGNHDSALGIFPLDAANGRPRVRLGGSGHRAGVQNHNAGLTSGCGPNEPLLAELLLDGGAVGLGGAASEIFYVKA